MSELVLDIPKIHLEEISNQEQFNNATKLLQRYYHVIQLMANANKAKLIVPNSPENADTIIIENIGIPAQQTLKALKAESSNMEGLAIIETAQEENDVTALIDVDQLKLLMEQLKDENIALGGTLSELTALVDQFIKTISIQPSKKGDQYQKQIDMVGRKITYVQRLNNQLLTMLDGVFTYSKNSPNQVKNYINKPDANQVMQLLDLVLNIYKLLSDFTVLHYKTNSNSKHLEPGEIREEFKKMWNDAYTELAGLLFFLMNYESVAKTLELGGTVQVVSTRSLDQSFKTDWKLELNLNGKINTIYLQVKSSVGVKGKGLFYYNVNARDKSFTGNITSRSHDSVASISLPSLVRGVLLETVGAMDRTLSYNMGDEYVVILVARPN